MEKEKKEKKKGVIIEALPAGTFKVRLEDGEEVLCHLSGKMRIHFIKVLPGDKVVVEISAYDKSRGRIIYREP